MGITASAHRADRPQLYCGPIFTVLPAAGQNAPLGSTDSPATDVRCRPHPGMAWVSELKNVNDACELDAPRCAPPFSACVGVDHAAHRLSDYDTQRHIDMSSRAGYFFNHRFITQYYRIWKI